jgi:hypothetical protein
MTSPTSVMGDFIGEAVSTHLQTKPSLVLYSKSVNLMKLFARGDLSLDGMMK